MLSWQVLLPLIVAAGLFGVMLLVVAVFKLLDRGGEPPPDDFNGACDNGDQSEGHD